MSELKCNPGFLLSESGNDPTEICLGFTILARRNEDSNNYCCANAIKITDIKSGEPTSNCITLHTWDDATTELELKIERNDGQRFLYLTRQADSPLPKYPIYATRIDRRNIDRIHLVCSYDKKIELPTYHNLLLHVVAFELSSNDLDSLKNQDGPLNISIPLASSDVELMLIEDIFNDSRSETGEDYIAVDIGSCYLTMAYSLATHRKRGFLSPWPVCLQQNPDNWQPVSTILRINTLQSLSDTIYFIEDAIPDTREQGIMFYGQRFPAAFVTYGKFPTKADDFFKEDFFLQIGSDSLYDQANPLVFRSVKKHIEKDVICCDSGTSDINTDYAVGAIAKLVHQCLEQENFLYDVNIAEDREVRVLASYPSAWGPCNINRWKESLTKFFSSIPEYREEKLQGKKIFSLDFSHNLGEAEACFFGWLCEAVAGNTAHSYLQSLLNSLGCEGNPGMDHTSIVLVGDFGGVSNDFALFEIRIYIPPDATKYRLSTKFLKAGGPQAGAGEEHTEILKEYLKSKIEIPNPQNIAADKAIYFTSRADYFLRYLADEIKKRLIRKKNLADASLTIEEFLNFVIDPTRKKKLQDSVHGTASSDGYIFNTSYASVFETFIKMPLFSKWDENTVKTEIERKLQGPSSPDAKDTEFFGKLVNDIHAELEKKAKACLTMGDILQLVYDSRSYFSDQEFKNLENSLQGSQSPPAPEYCKFTASPQRQATFIDYDDMVKIHNQKGIFGKLTTFIEGFCSLTPPNLFLAFGQSSLYRELICSLNGNLKLPDPQIHCYSDKVAKKVLVDGLIFFQVCNQETKHFEILCQPFERPYPDKVSLDVSPIAVELLTGSPTLVCTTELIELTRADLIHYGRIPTILAKRSLAVNINFGEVTKNYEIKTGIVRQHILRQLLEHIKNKQSLTPYCISNDNLDNLEVELKNKLQQGPVKVKNLKHDNIAEFKRSLYKDSFNIEDPVSNNAIFQWFIKHFVLADKVTTTIQKYMFFHLFCQILDADLKLKALIYELAFSNCMVMLGTQDTQGTLFDVQEYIHIYYNGIGDFLPVFYLQNLLYFPR